VPTTSASLPRGELNLQPPAAQSFFLNLAADENFLGVG